jgi:hypothetical protein
MTNGVKATGLNLGNPRDIRRKRKESSEYKMESESGGPGPATIRDEIISTLQNFKRTREFTVGGNGSPHLPSYPGICIKGIVAEDIKKVARVAPFGKGDGSSKVDPKVRKAYRIEANLITFANPSWETSIQSLVEVIAKELKCGKSTSISALLYKGLLYEAGGHFAMHRDTEKEPHVRNFGDPTTLGTRRGITYRTS